MGSHTEKIIERELEIYWKWKIYAIVWAEERIEVFYVLGFPLPVRPSFFPGSNYCSKICNRNYSRSDANQFMQ